MLRLFSILVFLTACTALRAEVTSIASGDVKSLIAALQDSSHGERELHLARAGVYVFQGGWRDGATTALPPITGAVTIHGNGSQLIIYSAASVGMLEVEPGASLRMARLTLSGATSTAVRNFGSASLWQVRIEDNFANDLPAAIDNFGTMAIDDSLISFNTVHGNSQAGAIRNRGMLSMNDGSLSNNQLFASRGSQRAAAALFNEGTATLGRVELCDNEAVLNHPGSISALANAGRGRLEVLHSRVVQGNTPAIAHLPGDTGVMLDQTILSSLWTD